ncbi:MAG: substrate-binding domain-containing protein [Deltaproteobacteria bacterium]
MAGKSKTHSCLTSAVLAAAIAFGPGSAVAETIRISGTGSAISTIRSLGDAYRQIRPGVRFAILPSMGSSGAVKAVLAGRLDIGLSGRSLTEEERANGAVEKEYARTPFVFAVNMSVKTAGLTLAEVADIYAGKRDRWENRSRIRLVLRPRSDSDTPVLKSMSPAMSVGVESALRREGMIVGMTDQEAVDLIQKIPGAFGATTLSLLVSEKRQVRVLALDGIVPSMRAIADGSYPYAKTLYMVTRKNPPLEIRRFIEFVRSPAGAAILAKNGQIPAN